jgi:polyisoprenoid-binding protein YceI
VQARECQDCFSHADILLVMILNEGKMKRNIALIAIAAAVVLMFNTISFAQLLKVKPNSMTVQGSSTLHEWESQITKSEWKGSFQIENLALVDIKNLEVKIPVESIKSTKGKMMDSKTYDAFNYEKFPFIVYTLTSVKINQNAGTIDAKGSLTMAGATRPIDLQVKYKILPGGDLQLTVSKKFKMTEFKMEPPTAMMGTIKVGDEVTVNFDVTVNTKLIQ